MDSLGGGYDGGNDQRLRTFCWLIMSVIVLIMDRIHFSVVMMDCIHCSIGNDKISYILRTLYLVKMMFIDVVLMVDMM